VAIFKIYFKNVWGKDPNNKSGEGGMIKKKLVLRSLKLCCFAVLASLLLAQNGEDFGPNFLQPGDSGVPLIDTINAQNEFRIGIQAYYRYAFNEAINAFERANAFRPGEPLILDWLGRAYYRSGFEETALSQWSYAADRSSSSSDEILLLSRVETVRNRRSLLPLMEEGQRYVEAGRYAGRGETNIYFRQPVSVLPLEDGTVWGTAYSSNELVRIDVNGLGYILADSDIDVKRGIKLCRKAVDRKPQSAAYLDSLGWAHFKNGDITEARSWLRRGFELSPHRKEIKKHMKIVVGGDI
jgi:tetratricopeptide (TPR) repeat protein